MGIQEWFTGEVNTGTVADERNVTVSSRVCSLYSKTTKKLEIIHLVVSLRAPFALK